MKKLLILLITTLLFAACSTTQRARSANTLLATGESVNAAMNLYGQLYRAGEISPQEEAKVDAAHAKFQTAYNAAVALVEHDLSTATPYEIATLASNLILIIDTL